MNTRSAFGIIHKKNYKPTRGYGYQEPPPDSGWNKGTDHSGIDYEAPQGARVRAPKKMKVVSVGENKWAGDQSVVAQRKKDYVMFAHLDRADVTPGQTIKRKQQVGVVGSKGNSTGPHLHLQRASDPSFSRKSTLDPKRYAKRKLVRD